MIVQLTNELELHFMDNDAKVSTCLIRFPVSTSIPTLQGLVTSWIALVQAVSSAVCIRATITVGWRETSHPYPGETSDSGRSGTFLFDTAASTIASFRIPSLMEDYIGYTGPLAGIVIDTTSPDIQSVINAISDGISGAYPCDPFGADITTLSSAFMEQY